MFITKNTGKKIAELRQKKNITQMELADLMGVSYQAVSNWERGNSMPDISKLPELAKVLEISIDELLSDGKPLNLVKNVISGTEKEYIVENNIELDTVSEIAPILKPKQTDDIVDTIIQNNKEEISIDDIVDIAPFLNEDKLYSIIKGLKGTPEQVCSLAPFMRKEAVDELVLNSFESCSIAELSCLAPFMSREAIDKLVPKCSDKCNIHEIIAIAPFMKKETLEKLVQKCTDEYNINELVSLAPFIHKETLSKLVQKAAKIGDFSVIKSLAPFLDRDTLGMLVDNIFKKDGIKGLRDIAPFL